MLNTCETNAANPVDNFQKLVAPHANKKSNGVANYTFSNQQYDFANIREATTSLLSPRPKSKCRVEMLVNTNCSHPAAGSRGLGR